MLCFRICGFLFFFFACVNSQQKWGGSMDRFQMPSLDNPLIQSLLPSVMGGKVDVKDVADKALRQGLQAADSSYEVDSHCLNHTEMFLESLISGQKWALRMLDAMGKPPSGLLNGAVKWLGSYDECLAVEATVNISGEITVPFKGQYCSATFTVGNGKPTFDNPAGVSLMIGFCLPSSCSEKDAKSLIQTLMSLLPVNITGLPDPKLTCQPEQLEYDTRAIVALTVCSFVGLLMLLATAYDVIIVRWMKPSSDVSPQAEAGNETFTKLSNKAKDECIETTNIHTTSYQSISEQESNGTAVVNEKVGLSSNGTVVVQADVKHKQKETVYRPGKLGQILLSFSIYTNGLKILNTEQASGVLTSVNGIRFVSMTWVIFCHSIAGTLGMADNAGAFVIDRMKRFTFLAIANAYVSVDTFFTLSGLLVSYLCLKEMNKLGGAKKFKWGMFYFHRFWRLTPPYVLWLMFYLCLSRYFSNGPTWRKTGLEKDFCEDTWWTNLLYVNNLVRSDHQCMGWSWYLANDMQFFVVSPLMLIPLYYSPVFGVLSCAAFLLISFISVGVLTTRSQLNAELVVAQGMGQAEASREIYIKPWCRIGPYAVGFLAGYILYRTKCKIRIPKILNLIGWAIAIGVGFAIVYGVYDKTGIPKFDYHVSALYHATHRSAWGAAVCWVIIACATGHGGWINTLLSWKPIVPLSRLTYCAYLVHPVVHFVYFGSKRALMDLTDIEESYAFVANTVFSYAVAFITSLAFEAPMMGLEKVLLGRAKNS